MASPTRESLRNVHDFADIDFSSPLNTDISTTLIACNRDHILNKSFKVSNNDSSAETLDSDERIDPYNEFSHNRSLRLLDELKTVLELQSSETSTQIEAPVLCNKSTQTISHESVIVGLSTTKSILLNKSTQINLEVNNDGKNKDSSDYVNREASHDEITSNIRLLQEKLRNDSKVFKVTLEQNQLEINHYLDQIDTLNRKIQKLEDIIRFGLIKSNPDTNTKQAGYQVDKCPMILHNDYLTANIFADSHGRGLSQIINSKSKHLVSGFIKPGVKASEILKNPLLYKDNIEDDVMILMLGANDIYSNQAIDFLRTLRGFLLQKRNSDIVICTIPLRYDLPLWSAVNTEIRKTNRNILMLGKYFKNLVIIDSSNIGRRFHTRQGLHLNFLGKKLISERILEELKVIISNRLKKEHSKIILPWLKQGNL